MTLATIGLQLFVVIIVRTSEIRSFGWLHLFGVFIFVIFCEHCTAIGMGQQATYAHLLYRLHTHTGSEDA